MLDILLTHSIARNEQKPPFFFSRFNFQRMKEVGNTHYCFHCGGDRGFTPDENGMPTNHKRDGEGGYDPMKRHDPVTHADAVIDGADKHRDPWSWLNQKIPGSFPYVVCIPSIY